MAKVRVSKAFQADMAFYIILRGAWKAAWGKWYLAVDTGNKSAVESARNDRSYYYELMMGAAAKLMRVHGFDVEAMMALGALEAGAGK